MLYQTPRNRSLTHQHGAYKLRDFYTNRETGSSIQIVRLLNESQRRVLYTDCETYIRIARRLYELRDVYTNRETSIRIVRLLYELRDSYANRETSIRTDGFVAWLGSARGSDVLDVYVGGVFLFF